MSAEDQDDVIAAEYAFGFLTGEEADAVIARADRDVVFAQIVARWEEVATSLATDGEESPRPSLWPAIAARLPGNENRALASQVRRWQLATGLAAAAALGLGTVALQRASTVVVPARKEIAVANPLVSVLRNPVDGSVVVVSFDRAGKLTIAPSSLDVHDGSAELWVIPTGGTPRSLGLVTVGSPEWRAAPSSALRDLAAGATIAVTIEPRGGSKTGQPGSAPVMSGTLSTT